MPPTLGLAFQIADDVLGDVTANNAVMGGMQGVSGTGKASLQF